MLVRELDVFLTRRSCTHGLGAQTRQIIIFVIFVWRSWTAYDVFIARRFVQVAEVIERRILKSEIVILVERVATFASHAFVVTVNAAAHALYLGLVIEELVRREAVHRVRMKLEYG